MCICLATVCLNHEMLIYMMAETMSLLLTFIASVSLVGSDTYYMLFKILIHLLNVFQLSGDLPSALYELTHLILKKNNYVESLYLCPLSLIRK